MPLPRQGKDLVNKETHTVDFRLPNGDTKNERTGHIIGFHVLAMTR